MVTFVDLDHLELTGVELFDTLTSLSPQRRDTANNHVDLRVNLPFSLLDADFELRVGQFNLFAKLLQKL